ncbi:MAG TPA: formate dehydrogenase accessory sulfurtransferase FdhD [Enterovirga sp.]|nr:formate dehydrogenase accessory sulfurtransferase FdhD [Enterovirga sp.]
MRTPVAAPETKVVDQEVGFRRAHPEPITTIAFDDGEARRGERAVAVEKAVNVVYGGVPFAVMMMTPADLEDFGAGFSLTEGVIESAADIRSIQVAEEPDGLKLLIDLVPGRLHEHLARRRAMSGRTGCGVCGIEDLASIPRARATGGAAPTVALASIRRALGELDERQELNQVTRAVHAAGWADSEGRLVAVREDVGRHNALDKLIGALLGAGIGPGDGFFVITSRCSFEMVEKAGAFGARTLVAISAPTSLALERARRLDITLIGIARRDTMTVFNGRERIIGTAEG